MDSVIFEELNFNGTLIQLTQSDGFDMMINATEMWKSVNGNKNNQPYEFLRLPSTIEFINALKSMPDSDRFTIVNSVKGNHSNGQKQGTWMNDFISLLYSKWIDITAFSKLLNTLIEFRILKSPERICSYNQSIVLEYLNNASNILSINIITNKIDIVIKDEKINFILGNECLTKEDLLARSLKTRNNIFILKTMSILFRFFIEKKDEYLINSIYLMIPTILDNIVSSNIIKQSEKQKTYLMKDSNTGLTKIGKAIDPKYRERTLQSEKPTISLFAVCENNIELELHDKFDSKRVRGEWFNLTDNEINNIVKDYKFSIN